jgi:ribosomal protein S27E
MGVGGDDKVGVFMTLKMLEERDVFKAAFFVDEEIGCVGSRACDFDFFYNSSLVLECDRKGAYDFVNSISGTKLYSREFSEAIKPILFNYGRTEVSGGMTDVLEIAYKTKICVANMSCGYYHPHSDDEFVNIDDVFMTYNMCNDIYDKLGFDLWRVSEDRNEYDYYSGYGYSSYGTGGYAKTFGNRSQSYLPAKEDDFDFDDWNKSFEVESERGVSDNLECAFCGGLHTEFDEYNRDVYCHDCGTFMTESEYLNYIETLAK